MALKVIGAGQGRTGTLSLKAALKELGFGPCYHMIELLAHPERVSYWEAAERGEAVSWDELFEGYTAGLDFPVFRYYDTLAKKYPDAKVILTVRDPRTLVRKCVKYHLPGRTTAAAKSTDGVSTAFFAAPA